MGSGQRAEGVGMREQPDSTQIHAAHMAAVHVVQKAAVHMAVLKYNEYCSACGSVEVTMSTAVHVAVLKYNEYCGACGSVEVLLCLST